MYVLIFNVYMNRFVNIKIDYNVINLFVVIRVYILVFVVELIFILCCIMNRSFFYFVAVV